MEQSVHGPCEFDAARLDEHSTPFTGPLLSPVVSVLSLPCLGFLGMSSFTGRVNPGYLQILLSTNGHSLKDSSHTEFNEDADMSLMKLSLHAPSFCSLLLP